MASENVEFVRRGMRLLLINVLLDDDALWPHIDLLLNTLEEEE